ncbi:hypothetical protein OH77DRAFT_1412137 [Trametes cingulata]|nr:hypothetical protein OH77DRAFT_1412137 [Trametes cingulata]
MSAIAAHYPSPSAAAAASAAADRRYADLAAHYDPSAYFSYSPPSLNTVPAQPAIDSASYVTAHPPASAYLSPWDAHAHNSSAAAPAVQSPSYSASSSSSASAHAYHPSAAPAASSGHPSVTASFSYAAHADYAVPSHRSSFHPPSSSSSSSSRALPSHHHNHGVPPSSPSSPSSSARRGSSYTSGPRSYSSLAAAAAANTTTSTTSGSSSTPRLQNATWDSAALYTIDPADPVSHTPPHSAYTRSTLSSPHATPASPPIKEEDAEGELIIEVSVPADPVHSAMPEVPLRATHAPPKMRKMMYSFRLENFAIHDGIRSAATQPGPGGIEVGPLREKPVEIEWQIQLEVPLIPGAENDESYRYAAAAAAQSKQNQLGYRAASPAAHASQSSRKPGLLESMSSPRLSGRGRADYAAAGSASPALSLEYPSASLDNDTWDGSSAYGSVADNSSGSVTTSTSSPTFAPIMTPAQSLGWSLRYQSGDVDLDSQQQQSTGFHRQPAAQPSLSRVSQSQGAYVFGGSGSAAKSSYHHQHHHSHQEAQQQQQQQAQYGYDNGGYSRRGAGGTAAAGRYAEVYASSGSSSGWYRECPHILVVVECRC